MADLVVETEVITAEYIYNVIEHACGNPSQTGQAVTKPDGKALDDLHLKIEAAVAAGHQQRIVFTEATSFITLAAGKKQRSLVEVLCANFAKWALAERLVSLGAHVRIEGRHDIMSPLHHIVVGAISYISHISHFHPGLLTKDSLEMEYDEWHSFEQSPTHYRRYNEVHMHIRMTCAEAACMYGKFRLATEFIKKGSPCRWTYLIGKVPYDGQSGTRLDEYTVKAFLDNGGVVNDPSLLVYLFQDEQKWVLEKFPEMAKHMVGTLPWRRYTFDDLVNPPDGLELHAMMGDFPCINQWINQWMTLSPSVPNPDFVTALMKWLGACPENVMALGLQNPGAHDVIQTYAAPYIEPSRFESRADVKHLMDFIRHLNNNAEHIHSKLRHFLHDFVQKWAVSSGLLLQYERLLKIYVVTNLTSLILDWERSQSFRDLDRTLVLLDYHGDITLGKSLTWEQTEFVLCHCSKSLINREYFNQAYNALVFPGYVHPASLVYHLITNVSWKSWTTTTPIWMYIATMRNIDQICQSIAFYETHGFECGYQDMDENTRKSIYGLCDLINTEDDFFKYVNMFKIKTVNLEWFRSLPSNIHRTTALCVIEQWALHTDQFTIEEDGCAWLAKSTTWFIDFAARHAQKARQGKMNPPPFTTHFMDAMNGTISTALGKIVNERRPVSVLEAFWKLFVLPFAPVGELQYNYNLHTLEKRQLPFRQFMDLAFSPLRKDTGKIIDNDVFQRVVQQYNRAVSTMKSTVAIGKLTAYTLSKMNMYKWCMSVDLAIRMHRFLGGDERLFLAWLKGVKIQSWHAAPNEPDLNQVMATTADDYMSILKVMADHGHHCSALRNQKLMHDLATRCFHDLFNLMTSPMNEKYREANEAFFILQRACVTGEPVHPDVLRRKFYLKGIGPPVDPHVSSYFSVSIFEHRQHLWDHFSLDAKIHERYILQTLDRVDRQVFNGWIYGSYRRFNKTVHAMNHGTPPAKDQRQTLEFSLTYEESYERMRRAIMNAPRIPHHVFMWRGIDVDLKHATGELVVFNRFTACTPVYEIANSFSHCTTMYLIEMPPGSIGLNVTPLKKTEFETILPDRAVFICEGQIPNKADFPKVSPDMKVYHLRYVGIATARYPHDETEQHIEQHDGELIRQFDFEQRFDRIFRRHIKNLIMR